MQDALISLHVGLRAEPNESQNRVTGRLPGARTAPVMRTWPCGQTGLDKTGAQTALTLRHSVGRVSRAIRSSWTRDGPARPIDGHSNHHNG